MKALCFIIITIIFSTLNSKGQISDTISIDIENGILEGTLLIPDNDGRIPIALIIAGSGPTDRDGNNVMMKNNSLKMLAEGLADNGIASFRYDKRGVGRSYNTAMKEIDLRFDIYVDDARKLIDMLDEDERFGSITVIGHSEGSLIGMIAARKENVDAFISLAGAGDAAGVILRKQLGEQPPKVLEESLPILEQLEKGKTVDSIPFYLFSLFRPSVQPYLISWFRYNPQSEIEKLQKPVFIIQGSTDIQISLEDAENLSKAKPDAELKIFEGMNHVLKEAEANRIANLSTYSKPDLPLKEGLTEAIVEFIRKNDDN